jgi:hypothetical protein
MNRYATAMDQLSDGFEETRRRLIDADVTEDSFGMLPESRDSAEVYEQRCTVGLDTLAAGTDVFSDLAQAFREIRADYEASDKSSARKFGR